MNQLSKVYNGSDNTTLLAEYTHHPTEERVLMKKVYENGVWKETIYYISDSFVSKKNASGLYNETYVMLNGQKIAQVVDGKTEYIHSDHLGSSSVVTNESGGIIETTLYEPYGGVLSGGESSRYDYESRENEPFGTMDFRFRQYSPEYGIFYQPDTLIVDVFSPQTLNRYMFEEGNPYRYVDPTGHFSANAGDAAEWMVKWESIFIFFPKAKQEKEKKERYEQLYDSVNQYEDLDSPYVSQLEVNQYSGQAEVVQAPRYLSTDLSFRLRAHQYAQLRTSLKGITGLSTNSKAFIYDQVYTDANGASAKYTTKTYKHRSKSRGKRSKITIYRNDDDEVVGGSLGNIKFSDGFAKKVEEALKEQKNN